MQFIIFFWNLNLSLCGLKMKVMVCGRSTYLIIAQARNPAWKFALVFLSDTRSYPEYYLPLLLNRQCKQNWRQRRLVILIAANYQRWRGLIKYVTHWPTTNHDPPSSVTHFDSQPTWLRTSVSYDICKQKCHLLANKKSIYFQILNTKTCHMSRSSFCNNFLKIL